MGLKWLVPIALKRRVGRALFRTLTCDAESASLLHAAVRGERGGTVFMRAFAPHPFTIRGHPSDVNALVGACRDRLLVAGGAVATIVDLGANIGATVAAAAVACPNAIIHAVEMDATNLEILRVNIASWPDRVVVHHAAISPGPSRELRYANVGDPDGFALTPDGSGQVSSLSLTALAEQIPPIDYLKVDIEGTERRLFREDTDWAPAVRHLRVEVHQPYTIAACISDLRRLGFSAMKSRQHANEVVAHRAADHSGDNRRSG